MPVVRCLVCSAADRTSTATATATTASPLSFAGNSLLKDSRLSYASRTPVASTPKSSAASVQLRLSAAPSSNPDTPSPPLAAPASALDTPSCSRPISAYAKADDSSKHPIFSLGVDCCESPDSETCESPASSSSSSSPKCLVVQENHEARRRLYCNGAPLHPTKRSRLNNNASDGKSDGKSDDSSHLHELTSRMEITEDSGQY